MANETDRLQLLQDLDSRHEQLLDELDGLNAKVESTLASLRPAEAPAAAELAASKPSGTLKPRPYVKRRVA